MKSSGDTHNITGSGSARRGSTPPLPARTDRRSLRGLPICHVISTTIPKHVPLITGCPPAATPPLTLHPPAQRYTSRQDRLRVLLRRGMGLRGGLIQSALGGKHTHHSSPAQEQFKKILSSLFLLTGRPLTHEQLAFLRSR